MATALPIPSTGTKVFDPVTGEMAEVWRRYFLSLDNLTPQIPPLDARYVVTRASTELPDEVNLGALASGYLQQVTAAGVATVSTTPTIPGTDITGAALSRVNDTNVTLTLSGTPGSALLRAVSLTLGWLGQLGLGRGGTNADLSATGGTSQVLRQSSSGAAVTVGQLASTDITGLASGTYTPTLTNVTNLDGSTAFVTNYSRVGTVVSVWGKVEVNPTALAATQLDISLPIASNFSAAEQLGGSANAGAVQQGAAFVADVANDRASMIFLATDTGNRTMSFAFGYSIV